MAVKVSTGDGSAESQYNDAGDSAYAYALGRNGVLFVLSGGANEKPVHWKVMEAWAPTAWVSVRGKMFADGTLETIGKNI